ncbi:MAG: PAS domain S-box protein, partial [Deltaproteobacteria bacterium]|nr:PAS domain S-box protein [Deltaproteobacteria bacterium]
MKLHIDRARLALLNWIADGRYDDSDFEDIRQVMLFNIGASVGITFSVLFGTIVFIRDIPYLWIIDYANALFLALLLVYTHKSKKYTLGLYTAIGIFTLLCFYLLVTGGDSATGYAWYFVYPLIAYFGLGTQRGTIATAILVVPVTFLFTLENPPGIIFEYTHEARVRFLGTFLMIAALSYIIEKVRENTESKLKKKNDDLSEAIFKLKETDEKLRRIGSYLENEVEKRTEQFREANTKLTREIEERVRVEEALRQSEEKFRLIAENTGDVITVIDKNMGVSYISPSCERVRGYTVEEAKEQTLDQVMTPESIKKIRSIYQEGMELEKKKTTDRNHVRVLELEEYRKDGSTVWVEDSLCFMRDKNQRPIGVLSISRDITERKQAEQERIRLEKQLIQAQKLEAIGTLAGGLAHDFNNLLGTIQGHASLMMLDIDSLHPHYERLKQMEQQVAHGASLTRQLLGFARGGKYEVKSTNMNNVIDRTLSMFSRTNKEIDIDLRLDWDLRTVEVDQGQMEQVLMNLFVNAGQAMPAGGKLTVQTDNCLLNDAQSLPHEIAPGEYITIT